MSKKRSRNKVSPEAFVRDLEDNEATMPEGAAMALTCEQYGISLDEGFDLIIALPEQQDDAGKAPSQKSTR